MMMRGNYLATFFLQLFVVFLMRTASASASASTTTTSAVKQSSSIPSLTTSRDGSSRNSNSTTKNGPTLHFFGKSNDSIFIEKPSDKNSNNKSNNNNNNNAYSLEQWFQSPESIPAILGNGKITKLENENSDNYWKNEQQESMKLFGIEIVPIYIHSITRPTSNKLHVDIVDSQTKIIDKKKQKTKNKSSSSGLKGIMQNTKFEGYSYFEIIPQDNGWTIELENSFGVSILLPPFCFVPPGFNSMWKGVMKRACHQRSSTLLKEIQESYEQWVQSKQQTTQSSSSSYYYYGIPTRPSLPKIPKFPTSMPKPPTNLKNLFQRNDQNDNIRFNDSMRSFSMMKDNSTIFKSWGQKNVPAAIRYLAFTSTKKGLFGIIDSSRLRSPIPCHF